MDNKMEDKLYIELEEIIEDFSGMQNYLRRSHKMCYLSFGYNSDQDWNIWYSKNNTRPFNLILRFKVTENMNYKEIAEKILRLIQK